eukprot:m.180921 g.180921  ORF g.180921 m.180921 type:complete len:156 (-) comp14660_c2_seq2:2344-2811(-)
MAMTRFLGVQGLLSRTFLGTSVARVTSTPVQVQCVRMMSEQNITITPPKEKKDEDKETMRKRLLYQSRKRGIRENDLIFSTYASKYLDTMQGDELKAYDVILNDHDNEWDMFYWLTGQSPLPEYLEQNKVMQELVEYTRNRSKEVRVSMPPLNHE